jgi:Cd2+/Zn2+-exporting ATPase
MKELKYRVTELSCANCADKIERNLNKLDIVEEATLSFVTKIVKLVVHDNIDPDELNVLVRKVVKETEDGVDVCEIVQKDKYEYLIDGLDCANCATKIETEIGKLEEVNEVKVNFMSKKITYVLSSTADKDYVYKKAESIINDIEPGVSIQELSQQTGEYSSMKTNHKKVYRLILGALIALSALFVSEESLLYLIIFVISYLFVGGEVVHRAIRNLVKGKVFDENFLLTVATIGAFAVGELPEAVAVMLFYQVGELFQEMALNKSRRSIKKLMSIRPDTANVKINGGVLEVKVEDVLVSDEIIIKPGERIPLDGIITNGESSIDTKALTGESVPLNVNEGDSVLSGCININGLITVRVTKLASESTVAKILELVENATAKKAPTENFITKFARVYTPIVTISAVLLAIIPPLIIEGATFEDWIYRALIFLVISCPCALVVSIPLGFFGGIGSASRNGILVKGGNYLEALNDIEIAVFDKTGTLTEGSFKVTEINTSSNYSNEELLEKAAYVESFSNHPIAVSIVKEYGKEINQEFVNNVMEITGLGIKANINGDNVFVGNARFMDKENISYIKSDRLGSVIYISINNFYIGNIVVSDQIKSDSKEAIKSLKELGIKKTVMLTGDKYEVAKNVAMELDLDEFYSELLPEDKLNILEELLTQKSKNGKVFFVGDGINDTPVLARADIGIAMGGLGSDAAIDVADVVIMTDELSKIVTGVYIAKRTRKIVWQNIFFALGVKFIFLALGAVGIATMWEAVIADVGVSIIAIFNAMRVLRYNEKKFSIHNDRVLG